MTQPQPPQIPEEPAPTGALALAAFEAAIAALVLGMYTAWLGLVSRMVLASFVMFGLSPDPTAIWAAIPQWTKQVDRLMSALEQIARAGWIDANSQLGVDVPFDVDDPLLQDQLARTRNLMVRTPDEVYRIVIRELGIAAERGESVEQQAARVRHVLDVTGTENWPARARTVAVTEVHRAYNMGATAAAQRIQRSNPLSILFKAWQSKHDSAVRPGHRLADGQIRLVSQPFIVAGEPLMAPGDPAGSPANVINCRCKQRFTWGKR